MDDDFKLIRFFRGDVELEHRPAGSKRCRPGREPHSGFPAHVVEADVGENDIVIAADRLDESSSPFARLAANLEDVREVRREIDDQLDAGGDLAEICYRDLFVAAAS
jgi:hypothetical protein